MITESQLDRIVKEEITKGEVRSIVDDKLGTHLKGKDFERMVRSITTDVLEEFFREMWRRNAFWKNPLKNR